MTRKTTFSGGQRRAYCEVYIPPPPSPLVEIPSLERAYRIRKRGTDPRLKGGRHGLLRGVERGDVRNAKFIAPAVFAATPPLQFGATQMTKLSINAKRRRRPRGGAKEGKVDTLVFPVHHPLVAYSWTTGRGERNCRFLEILGR